MLWFLATISAYFLLAVVASVDKYLLTGSIPSPKIYSFYVGMLGILVLILIPFGFLTVPELPLIFLALVAGFFHIFALFVFYTALKKFETSRVVPAVGGFLPIFTFVLVYFFSKEEEILRFEEYIAFLLLVLGSVLVTFKKGKTISLKSLPLSVLSAIFWAISFVLSKFVYSTQPFWSGFIWIMIGSFLTALCFLFSKEVKEEIFKRKEAIKKKTAFIFILNQGIGGGAFVLQNWAIALVPLTFLPFINALEGTKYVFLLIFAVLFSLKSPQILKEEISKKVLLQKIIAILLIGAGLALLAFK